MEKFKLYRDYFDSLSVQFLNSTADNKTFYREHEEKNNFPCMQLMYPHGRLSDNGGDGLFQHRNISINILDHLTDTESDGSIDDILDAMELKGFQIVQQIDIDAKERVTNELIVDFEIDSVKFVSVVNTEDQLYGVNFSFSLRIYHPNNY